MLIGRSTMLPLPVINIVLIQATNTVPSHTSIITIHTVTSYINPLKLVDHTIVMGLLPSVMRHLRTVIIS